ncbi:MAG: hypothetical protein HQL09_03950 [Nitrospirae bacterium]|nr:hypothetical protein [Nitrospirota bacterium]
MSAGINLLLYTFLAVLVFISGSIQLHMIITASIVFSLFSLPFKRVRSGIVPISLFLGFTFFSNLFYQSGRVIAVAGPLTVTEEGLRIAAVRAARVFDMVYAAKILTHITPLEEMICSLRKLFQPLGRFGLPVHDFFSIMTLTLQCFPVLKQKLYAKYSEAKMQAGPNSVSTVKMMASFMVPLFVESMADPEKFFMSGAADNETEGK